jgi:hypothetical protein
MNPELPEIDLWVQYGAQPQEVNIQGCKNVGKFILRVQQAHPHALGTVDSSQITLHLTKDSEPIRLILTPVELLKQIEELPEPHSDKNPLIVKCGKLSFYTNLFCFA